LGFEYKKLGKGKVLLCVVWGGLCGNPQGEQKLGQTKAVKNKVQTAFDKNNPRGGEKNKMEIAKNDYPKRHTKARKKVEERTEKAYKSVYTQIKEGKGEHEFLLGGESTEKGFPD